LKDKDKANITAPRSRFNSVVVDIDLKDNIDAISISVGFKTTTRHQSNGFDALTNGPWCAINGAVDSIGQVAELSTNAIEFTAARLLSEEDLYIDLAMGLTITWTVGLKAPTRQQVEVNSNARAWQQQLGVNTSLVETGHCLVLHQRLAPHADLC